MYASAMIDLNVFVSGLTHEQLGEVRRLVEYRIQALGIDPKRLEALPAVNAEEIQLLEQKRPIDAIRAYRARTFCGLKESKDACDKWREENRPDLLV